MDAISTIIDTLSVGRDSKNDGGRKVKAILVVEMPKNCAKCKLQYLQGIGEAICNAVDWEERPSWCPLKPMPEKQEYAVLSPSYRRGWNDCIEELEK